MEAKKKDKLCVFPEQPAAAAQLIIFDGAQMIRKVLKKERVRELCGFNPFLAIHRIQFQVVPKLKYINHKLVPISSTF